MDEKGAKMTERYRRRGRKRRKGRRGITVMGGEVNEEPVYDGRYSLGIGEIDGDWAPLWSLATEPEASGVVAN